MMSDTPKIAAIGEVMVEYSPARLWDSSGEYYQLGFAGDTFNTAVTLSRLGLSTTYVTRLGDDPFSDKIIRLMNDEGMDSAWVDRLPERQPGLYVISNSAGGERSFRYWRSEAPARELWCDDKTTDRLEAALVGYYSHIYLSGITLAIMAAQPRDRLREFLIRFRNGGGAVVFDSNYRPRLWPDLEQARKTIGAFIELADIALLTLEDEQALWGIGSAQELISSRQHSVRELVIKRGSEPIILCNNDDIIEIPVPMVDSIVDTTGAGDAFNAGYLAARIHGKSAQQAVALGNKAAAIIIRKPGGIVEPGYFAREIAAYW